LIRRRVEENLDRVADDLGDRALPGKHDIGHAAHIFVEQSAKDVRLCRLDQRSKAGYVGKDSRNFTPLHLHAIARAIGAGQASSDLGRKIT